MKNQLFILVLIIGFATACNKSDPEDDTGKSGYLKGLVMSKKTLAIGIDSLTINRSTQLVYYQKSKDWLFNLNWTTNEIQMYNLEDKLLHKALKFPVEGNNGVGRIFSFHVHNLDSIFLFQQSSPTVFLTDTSQVIRNEITVQVPEMHTPPFVHATYFSSPAVVIGERLVVKTRPADDYSEITNDALSERFLTYKINLNDGDTEFLHHKFPSEYLNDGYKLFDFSFAKSLDKYVYSFHSDHNLYYTNSASNALIPVNAKSRYLKSFQHFNSSGSREEHYRYYASAPNYKSLIYDKFRNVFYRFCYPEIEVNSEEEIMKYRFIAKVFSILILDSDLNIIGETLFDKDKFLSDNVFIAEEGLYLSKNHPDNPELKEDFLSFALFELTDID